MVWMLRDALGVSFLLDRPLRGSLFFEGVFLFVELFVSFVTSLGAGVLGDAFLVLPPLACCLAGRGGCWLARSWPVFLECASAAADGVCGLCVGSSMLLVSKNAPCVRAAHLAQPNSKGKQILGVATRQWPGEQLAGERRRRRYREKQKFEPC